MRTIRVFGAVAIAAGVALIVYAARQKVDNRAATVDPTDPFIRIAHGLSDNRVEELLGGPGEPVTVPGWPSVIGEVPGYQKSYSVDYHPWPGSAPQGKILVFPEEPVRWRLWRVEGPRRWIAVCFCDYGGVRVVGKKSGLHDRLPGE